jgi:hypothetical protein
VTGYRRAAETEAAAEQATSAETRAHWVGSIYRLFNTGGAGRSDGRGHIPFSHLQCERIARGISRGAVAASRPAHGARDLQLKCNDFLAARVGESECVCACACAHV